MNLTDKRFKYTPACSTNIRKLFKRVRAEQERNRRERELKVEELKQPTRRTA